MSQGIIDISDIPEPDEDVRRAEAELERVLMDLSYEEVTDLVTLMLIGREDDADMTLEGVSWTIGDIYQSEEYLTQKNL